MTTPEKIAERKIARNDHIDQIKEKIRKVPFVFSDAELHERLYECRHWATIDMDFNLLKMDAILRQAASVYYHRPEHQTIADCEFDEARISLVNTYSMVPYLKPEISIVDMVGAPVVSGGLFDKYEHLYPMMSLDNVFNEEEFYDWYNKLVAKLTEPPEMVLEYKYDGLAIELVYTNGSLVTAGTRGDGLVGDDITENVRRIKSVNLATSIDKPFVVYGEAMVTIEGLKAYNRNNTKQLKNCRNAAAGSLRLTDSDEVAKRPLTFMPYGVRTTSPMSSHTEEMNELAKHGFQVMKPLYKGTDPAKLYEAYTAAYKHRDDEDFEYDGCVIKLNDLRTRQSLGYEVTPQKGVMSRAPKWAIAFKFPTDIKETTLIDVVFQVGRHGTVTPVAKVTPVEVGGVTVSSVTLHNRAELESGCYSIGDTIKLHRAGEVVPQILESHHNGDVWTAVEYPKTCPSCGGELTIDQGTTVCNNILCVAQLLRRLEHFVSRSAFNIEGLSGGGIRDLYNAGLVNTPVDIFKLTKEDLLKMDGWKDKKANNLLTAIEKSKTIPLSRFIYAQGCASAGRSTSKALSIAFKDVYSILADTRAQTLANLMTLPKVGEVMANDIAEFFSNPAVGEVIDQLISSGIVITEDVVSEVTGGKFTGMYFCITGKFVNYTRNGLRDRIVELGGTVTDSVTKKTNYLICGTDAGSKLTKANNNGFTKVIVESDISDLLH